MKPPVHLSIPSLGWGETSPVAALWPQQLEEGVVAVACQGPACRGRGGRAVWRQWRRFASTLKEERQTPWDPLIPN